MDADGKLLGIEILASPPLGFEEAVISAMTSWNLPRAQLVCNHPVRLRASFVFKGGLLTPPVPGDTPESVVAWLDLLRDLGSRLDEFCDGADTVLGDTFSTFSDTPEVAEAFRSYPVSNAGLDSWVVRYRLAGTRVENRITVLRAMLASDDRCVRCAAAAEAENMPSDGSSAHRRRLVKGLRRSYAPDLPGTRHISMFFRTALPEVLVAHTYADDPYKGPVVVLQHVAGQWRTVCYLPGYWIE